MHFKDKVSKKLGSADIILQLWLSSSQQSLLIIILVKNQCDSKHYSQIHANPHFVAKISKQRKLYQSYVNLFEIGSVIS